MQISSQTWRPVVVASAPLFMGVTFGFGVRLRTVNGMDNAADMSKISVHEREPLRTFSASQPVDGQVKNQFVRLSADE